MRVSQGSLKKISRFYNKHNKALNIIGAVTIVGMASLLITRAAPFTASIEPESGVISGNARLSGGAVRFGGGNAAGVCGKRVTNYSYAVPFGNAVWNQPVCSLARHPKSSNYASRLLEWGHVNDGNPSADSRNGFVSASPAFPTTPTILDPDGLANLFSREVYYASKATTQTKIQSGVYSSNLDGEDLPYGDPRHHLPDTAIPWNPNWKTGEGGDNEIVILDDRPGPTQGRIYGISGYKRGFQAVTQCGPFARNERICSYHVDVGRDLNGNYIDYRTYEGFVSNRGVGLSYYATLVTPEEVQAGEIRHAIGMSIPNTAFGPICTKQQLGTNAEGNTCGTAVAPASKFEWGSSAHVATLSEEPLRSIYSLDKAIPEGMRFAIDITDAQIETWINSRANLKNNQRRSETARIFARAIRDYGLMVVDTNGARPDIQTSGGVNPDSGAMWKNLAMGPEHKDDLLEGLINSGNLYVVDPPTLTCKDGSTSKNYCEWTHAAYKK